MSTGSTGRTPAKTSSKELLRGGMFWSKSTVSVFRFVYLITYNDGS